MNKEEAEKILKEKKQSELDEIEAKKTLEEDRLKKIQEIEESEKKIRKDEFEKLKKAFPKQSQEVFCKCWKCGKEVSISHGKHVTKSNRVIIIGGCKCGSYNVVIILKNSQYNHS